MRPAPAAAFHAMGLAAALALKWYQSRAGVDDLGWVLAPACRVAGLLTGASFEREAGAGWVDHAHRLIVGASCSGMNFLILSFLTFHASHLHRLKGMGLRCAWLGASLCAAWALTVMANAARIWLVIHLGAMDWYRPFVTPAAAHRAAGVLVYCTSLVAAHMCIGRILDRLAGPGTARSPASALAPIGWYLGMTLGAPLAAMAWRGGGNERFSEHAVIVVSVCLLVAAGAFAFGPAGWRWRSAPPAGP